MPFISPKAQLALLFLVSCSYVRANTLCVNPGGGSGCYSTIGAAVAASSSGDQINIAAGEYMEDVIVTKPLTLSGASSDAVVINARGLANGIYVDGLDNPGLANVLITGLTVTGANYEGILVTNASYVIISNNHVVNNDLSLNFSTDTCSGQPAFETNETQDCGEGIHLVGVNFSTIANNEVELNTGGILLTDETAVTYAVNVTGNSVHDNGLACGITMASHPPSPAATSKLPYGVINNSVVGNNIYSNGLIIAGAGAGVGIFAAGPGNMAFGNQVIGNTIVNNGLPGVTVHNHAAPPGTPPVNLNDTVIIGNFISGNGADTEDAATSGTAGINIYSQAPIYAIEILENTIQNEAVGVVMNTAGSMELHLNNLLNSGIGVANTGAGQINGSMNYFGCIGGPGTAGCSTVTGSSVHSTPFMNTKIGSAISATSPVGSAPAAPAAIRPAK